MGRRDNVIIEYAKWKLKVRQAVDWGCSDDSLALGFEEWINEQEPLLRDLKSFQNFKREHEAMCNCIADILSCVQGGDFQTARQLTRSEMYILIDDSTRQAISRLEMDLKRRGLC